MTPRPSTWKSEDDEVVIISHPAHRAEDAVTFHDYLDPGEAAFLVLGQYDLNEFKEVESARKVKKAKSKAEQENHMDEEKPAPTPGHENRGMDKAQWPLGRITVYEENGWEIPEYVTLGNFEEFQSVATPGCVDETLLTGIPVSIEEFGCFLPNHYAKFGLSNRLEHNGWESTRWSDFVSKQRGLSYKSMVKKNTLQNQLKLSKVKHSESDEHKAAVLNRTVDDWIEGDCVRNPKRAMDYYIIDMGAGVSRENFPTAPNTLLLTKAIECCLDNGLYSMKLSQIQQLARKYGLGKKVPPPPSNAENRDRESFNAYEKELIIWRRR